MKFYQKTWFIILTLLLLAPLGIFLMFKYTQWGKPLKIVLSIVSLLIFIPVLVSVLGDNTDTPPTETPNVSDEAPASPSAPAETADLNATIFTRYVEQDFNTVAVREIMYKPQDGYITVDFDVAEGDYFIATTQDEGNALALYACSKVANLFGHSQGAGLYPEGTEVTFNAYYLGKNVFGFTFDAETIESSDWLSVTEAEFVELWKDYYINQE